MYAMKKRYLFATISLTACLIGCCKKTSTSTTETEGNPPAATQPQAASSNQTKPDPVYRVGPPVDQKKAAIQNSFWAVNQHLDLGGSFYLYRGTEQVLAKLDGYLDGISALADAAGTQLDERERQQMAMVLDMGRSAYERIGVRDISGFGMSSFALEKDLRRNVMVLHHYPEKKNGLLWKIMGTQSHEQHVLKMLPADTVMAIQVDLDLVVGFDWMRKFITDTAPPEIVAEFAKGLAQMNQAIKFEGLLRSTGGEMGFFVTLNDAKQIKIPLPAGAPQDLNLAIAEPAFALMLKVKDEQLMGLITQLLQNPDMAPMLKQSVEDGVTLHTLTPPELPLPIDLTPTLMKAGDYIIFTTSLKLAKDILAVKGGGNEGLAGTAEFKRFAGDINLKGNHLNFMSGRLGKEFGKITKIGMAALEEQPAIDPLVFDLIKQFAKADGAQHSGYLTVLRVTPEGFVMESRSSLNAMGAAPLLLVPGVGIAASMLLPALARAKGKANAIKSVNNASQLQKAMMATAQDNNNKLPTADKWCDAIFQNVTVRIYASPQDPVASSMAQSGQKVSSYAFNKALSGKDLNQINPGTVMVFETDLGWNGSGGLKEALEFLEFFDGHAIAVGTADGAVRQVSSPDELRRMRWEP